MKDFTIAIYCFLDDLLVKMGTKPIDKHRKLTDAQIITTAVLTAKYFYSNQASACIYLEAHYGFTMPDKSNFNRRLHQLADLIADVFSKLGLIFKHLTYQAAALLILSRCLSA